MSKYVTLINAAHLAATAAMNAALEQYRARVKAMGQEAWDRQVKACGTEQIEPLYCGFAWVIVPRASNLEMIKELKTAAAFGGGNRDMGSPAGYSRKGVHTATDWHFHGPGEFHGQSMDIKEVGAQAFVKHLTDNGVVGAFSQSRAD